MRISLPLLAGAVALTIAATARSSFPAEHMAPSPQDAPGSDEEQPAAKPLPMERFLFFAMLEGLYRSGVKNDVVAAMLERDGDTGWPRHFIWACPVCMPCFDALLLYEVRPNFAGRKMESNTFGNGLPPLTRMRILGSDPVARQEALTTLIQSWVQERIERLRLTPVERTALEKHLDKGRETGLVYLESYPKPPGNIQIYEHLTSCPWCEGANEGASAH